MTLSRCYISITIFVILLSCNLKSKNQDTISLLQQEDRAMQIVEFPHSMLPVEIVKHTAYSLAYSEEYEQAVWVQYKLFKSNLELPKVERRNEFKEDNQVSTGSATLDDYKGSGYDRGHIAPCADFSYSNTTMLESFFMSNMSPQTPSFNRGKWKVLESRVREYAFKYDSLLIITGPVLYSIKERTTIGQNDVTIPKYFYKIIIALEDNNFVSFLMPNIKINDPIDNYIVSIDSIESITQIDFFYNDSTCHSCNEEQLINKNF